MKKLHKAVAITLSSFIFISTANYSKECLTIAHRGASAQKPENTLAAFAQAISLGADMIEFDVRISSSGDIMVIHDSTVNRTTNGTGKVIDMSLKELKQLEIGDEKEKIPTLQEVFDLVDRQAIINIEVKSDNLEAPIIDLINRYVETKGWQYADFVISSFNHHRLARIKKLLPEIRIGVLIAHLPIDYAAIGKQLNVHSLHVFYESVNQAFIDDTHEKNMKFFVFTLDDQNEMERLKALGVDGIITNMPEK